MTRELPAIRSTREFRMVSLKRPKPLVRAAAFAKTSGNPASFAAFRRSSTSMLFQMDAADSTRS
jgi:hypothetical protein